MDLYRELAFLMELHAKGLKCNKHCMYTQNLLLLHLSEKFSWDLVINMQNLQKCFSLINARCKYISNM